LGEVLITRKSQRGVPPDGFTYPTQILTENGIWKCPRSGTYYISCIGCGGLAAIALNPTGDAGCFFAGGGAGGIAESSLKLQKGKQIPITVDSAISSFGSILSALSGQGGSIENTYKIISTAGIGGNAVGGVKNYSGGNGVAIKNGWGIIGGTTNKTAKFGGVTGDKVIAYHESIDGVAFVLVTLNNNNILKYGGGQGYCSYIDQPSMFRTPKVTTEPNGAVIIEYIK